VTGSRTSRSNSQKEYHASSVGRWEANLAESDAALIWEGTRDLWEQVDPELRWNYRQPQGCRP
jgi:hypothetical protein